MLQEPEVVRRFQANVARFREVRYPDAYHMPRHDHDDDCIVLVRKGVLSDERAGNRFDVGSHGVVFVPSGRTHMNDFLGGVQTFDIVLSPGTSDAYATTLRRVVCDRSIPSGPAAWIAGRMLREFRAPDSATSLALDGLTLELLAELSRAPTAGGGAPRWLGTAVDYLHAHLSEPVSLAHVAWAAGVHPAHLARTMRQHKRCTVADYLRRIRIERARELVSTTDLPLSTVAFQCGFADHSHFCRAYKAHTGRTPGQDRKSQLSD
jgi:AraC family transcriptional regulator